MSEVFREESKSSATRKAQDVGRSAWESTKRASKTGTDKVAKALDKGQRSVTQKDAFEEYNALLEELSMIVAIQHARIVDLEARVASLEER